MAGGTFSSRPPARNFFPGRQGRPFFALPSGSNSVLRGLQLKKAAILNPFPLQIGLGTLRRAEYCMFPAAIGPFFQFALREGLFFCFHEGRSPPRGFSVP